MYLPKPKTQPYKINIYFERQFQHLATTTLSTHVRALMLTFHNTTHEMSSLNDIVFIMLLKVAHFRCAHRTLTIIKNS